MVEDVRPEGQEVADLVAERQALTGGNNRQVAGPDIEGQGMKRGVGEGWPEKANNEVEKHHERHFLRSNSSRGVWKIRKREAGVSLLCSHVDVRADSCGVMPPVLYKSTSEFKVPQRC